MNLKGPDDLAEAVDAVRRQRPPGAGPFDVVAEVEPGTDPAPFRAAGATWCLTAFDPLRTTLDQLRGVMRDGPPA